MQEASSHCTVPEFTTTRHSTNNSDMKFAYLHEQIEPLIQCGTVQNKKDSRHSDQGITLLLLKTVGTPTKGSLIYNELQHGKSPKVQREQ